MAASGKKELHQSPSFIHATGMNLQVFKQKKDNVNVK